MALFESLIHEHRRPSDRLYLRGCAVERETRYDLSRDSSPFEWSMTPYEVATPHWEPVVCARRSSEDARLLGLRVDKLDETL